MTNTQDLIKRIEAADGPDRELDAEIALALGWRQKCGSHWGIGAPHWWLDGKCNKDVIGYWDGHPSGTLPFFTSSIDASTTLVPEGYSIRKISDQTDRFGYWDTVIEKTVTHEFEKSSGYSRAKTPALALCAAALEARFAQ